MGVRPGLGCSARTRVKTTEGTRPGFGTGAIEQHWRQLCFPPAGPAKGEGGVAWSPGAYFPWLQEELLIGVWAGATYPWDLAPGEVSHRCTCKVQLTCSHLAHHTWRASHAVAGGHSSLQSAGPGVHRL